MMYDDDVKKRANITLNNESLLQSTRYATTENTIIKQYATITSTFLIQLGRTRPLVERTSSWCPRPWFMSRRQFADLASTSPINSDQSVDGATFFCPGLLTAQLPFRVHTQCGYRHCTPLDFQRLQKAQRLVRAGIISARHK